MWQSTSLESMYVSQLTEIKSTKKCVPINGTICIYQILHCITPCLVHYQHQLKLINFSLTLRDTPLAQSSTYLTAFRFGFSIDYVGCRCNFSSKNLLSAITNPKAVDDKLDKEVLLGRIVGLFDGLFQYFISHR